MEIQTNSTEEPLIEIVVDRQGLIVMISAADAAITYANENALDVSYYHQMYNSLKEQYERFFGPYNEKIAEN